MSVDITKKRFKQHELMMKLMLADARWKIAIAQLESPKTPQMQVKKWLSVTEITIRVVQYECT